ncbi:MAG: PleD family two-component system response regulator [Nitratireductor sp.]|nr:PleD family two-component system response regulator [Nitratireductor sp.]
MSGRILVVDDIEANVRLLEARLMAEYFQVLTASNGRDALEICANGECDVVLLDVMMPEMDGFEVCRRLKADPRTMHLPVVMVTALDQIEDRVQGLNAGADDFLTKPVNDLALVTRVKSLVRLKMLTDELRLRATTGQEISVQELMVQSLRDAEAEKPRILVVDDKPSSYERIVKYLSAENRITLVSDPKEALLKAADGDFDAAIISLSLADMDALRLCAQIKSLEKTRMLPLLIVSELEQEQKVIQALDMGINDYVRRPIDRNEILARTRTQVRRKRFNLLLRDSVQQTIEMAVTDALTGLNNRRYLDNHLPGMIEKAQERKAHLSLIICDIDRFKLVNDNHGHDVGDEVIAEFARRIKKNVRNIDLACRFGGEEFVIAMPETDMKTARIVAERIRNEVSVHPFVVDQGGKQLAITVSLGIATLESADDTPESLLKRADVGLYQAKRGGRNMVVFEAA